jgi:hypothetical protein
MNLFSRRSVKKSAWHAARTGQGSPAWAIVALIILAVVVAKLLNLH